MAQQDSSGDRPEPAWGAVSYHEPRWPATAVVAVAVVLYLSLPNRLVLGPNWVLPALEAALIVPLMVVSPHRRPNEPTWQRIAAVVLIALVNIANVISLVLLIHELIVGKGSPQPITGPSLLFSSILIWLTNVLVFALWYWELDRGGPDDRMHADHRQPDFLFPQMVTPQSSCTGWTPGFVDYLYVSLTNATAFSPTDTMPLTRWAKSLMSIQALTSLLTIALVAARAVNILN